MYFPAFIDNHKKQLEKEKAEQEEKERELQQQIQQQQLQQQQQQQQMMQQQLAFAQNQQFTRSPRAYSPRFQGSQRHQPYPGGRPPRRPPAPNFGPGGSGGLGPQVPGLTMPGARTPVKLERTDSDDAPNQSGVDGANVSNVKSEGGSGNVLDSSANAGGDSDGSNVPGGDTGSQMPDRLGSGGDPQTPGGSSSAGGLDTDTNVKLEALTEDELDLEITGVEPGSYTGWDPDTSTGSMDYAQGATGNAGDMQSQAGYSKCLVGATLITPFLLV